MITVEQIRGARAMLGLKQDELSQKAGISTGTLNNIERGFQKDPKISTLRAIRQALEAEGIEFSNPSSGEIGILLKPRKADDNKNMTVLIIDDNTADRTLYKTWLSKQKGTTYKVIEAADAKSGYSAFLNHQPDCILLDFMMYGKNGFQMLVELKKDHVKVPPIIFVTAMPNESVKKNVLSLGVFAYLDKKGLTIEKLNETVMRALMK